MANSSSDFSRGLKEIGQKGGSGKRGTKKTSFQASAGEGRRGSASSGLKRKKAGEFIRLEIKKRNEVDKDLSLRGQEKGKKARCRKRKKRTRTGGGKKAVIEAK